MTGTFTRALQSGLDIALRTDLGPGEARLRRGSRGIIAKICDTIERSSMLGACASFCTYLLGKQRKSANVSGGSDA